MSGLDLDEIKNQPEVQETMNHLLNAFQYFDTNKSGFINKKDLVKVLSQQNLDPQSVQDISDHILSDLDKNRDGKIGLPEFLSTLIVRSKQDIEAVEYVIAHFDLDH